MARLMWVFAVSGLITMRSAISSLDRPCATRATASRSRLVSPSRAAPAAGVRRLGDVAVDQFAGDRRREQGVAAGGDADGVEEVLRLDVLDEEPGGAGAQRVEDVLVQAVVGQDDDVHAGQGRVRGDAPGRLDAVHDRHLDVDERDVGQVLPGQRQAFAPSAASATTSMSSSTSRSARNPLRMSGWSSTSRTRIMTSRSTGKFGLDGEAALAARRRAQAGRRGR